MAAALAPLSFVLAHNLSFLLAAGDGTRAGALLQATGHTRAWFDAVRLVIAVSALFGLAGAGRIAVLWRSARRLERRTGQLARADWRMLARLVVRTWLAVTLATALWFTVQENAERLSVGEGAPLLGPLLEGGGAGPLLLIPLVALLTAFVGALFRWSVTMLLARIRAARIAANRHRPAVLARPVGRVARPAAHLARWIGLRGPPLRAEA